MRNDILCCNVVEGGKLTRHNLQDPKHHNDDNQKTQPALLLTGEGRGGGVALRCSGLLEGKKNRVACLVEDTAT